MGFNYGLEKKNFDSQWACLLYTSASAVLGLNVKMLPLCSDGSVLGLTVFQRCGFTVTLGDGTKPVSYTHLRKLLFMSLHSD